MSISTHSRQLAYDDDPNDHRDCFDANAHSWSNGLHLRKLFEQLLSRDLEKHKANLQIEFEQSRLRLENELQTKLFEFQTKFSLYHQKQASVIGELYEKLSEAEMYVSHSVHPIQFDGRPFAEKADEADEKCVDLARFYNRHRIYLDEDVCQKNG